jgi:hypothetical protein
MAVERVRTTEELLVELIDEVRAAKTSSDAAKGSSEAVLAKLGELIDTVNGYKTEVQSLRDGVADQIENRVKHELDSYLPIRPSRIPTHSG